MVRLKKFLTRSQKGRVMGIFNGDGISKQAASKTKGLGLALSA